MNDSTSPRTARYRVWITSWRGEETAHAGSPPPRPVALEPAEKGTMSARRAARYVAAFNRAAAAHCRAVRAVALPVAVRYEGDAAPGEPL